MAAARVRVCLGSDLQMSSQREGKLKCESSGFEQTRKGDIPPNHCVGGLTPESNGAVGSPGPPRQPEAPQAPGRTPTLDGQGGMGDGGPQDVASEAGVAAGITAADGGQEQRGVGQDADAGTLGQRLSIPPPLHGGGGLPRHGTVQQRPLPGAHHRRSWRHRHRGGTWAGRGMRAVAAASQRHWDHSPGVGGGPGG